MALNCLPVVRRRSRAERIDTDAPREPCPFDTISPLGAGLPRRQRTQRAAVTVQLALILRHGHEVVDLPGVLPEVVELFDAVPVPDVLQAVEQDGLHRPPEHRRGRPPRDEPVVVHRGEERIRERPGSPGVLSPARSSSVAGRSRSEASDGTCPPAGARPGAMTRSGTCSTWRKSELPWPSTPCSPNSSPWSEVITTIVLPSWPRADSAPSSESTWRSR